MMKMRRHEAITLIIGVIGLAMSVVADAEEATSTANAAALGSQIIITDLGLLPGGFFSFGSAINNQPIVVGLADDTSAAYQRPLWDANTGAIVGFAENLDPASTAVPEHLNDGGEMAGTERIRTGSLYYGVYWNAAGQAFELPPLAGTDPDYGRVHVKGHGINHPGQIVGGAKDGTAAHAMHAVRWQNKDTAPEDLGFLGPGTPLDYSEAFGVNDLGHVVGTTQLGPGMRGFLWREGQMIDLGALSGQVVSEANAISNTGFIAGKCNLYPVIWQYDIADPNSTPAIHQLPIPSGFFSATPTAVNDSGAVAGYAGSPNIDAHAILWRGGTAIDLGAFQGGRYSVAKGINNLGQIIGEGIAGDNQVHALMWTIRSDIFVDAFETGDTSGWSITVP